MQNDAVINDADPSLEIEKNTYTYEEAYKACLEYFNGSEIAASTYLDKYALRDESGAIIEKTPDQLHRRLAKEFARVEKNKFSQPLSEEEIYEDLKDFSCIIAQGSPMYGIGNPYQIVSLSNCVHGEAMVYTKEHGLIKMKDVKKGDHVLTHKNRFKKVLNHWSNGYKETITIVRSFTNKRASVRNEQEMSRFLAVTPEHKIYDESENWVEAKDFINKQNKKLKEPMLEYDEKVPEFLPLDMGRNLEITKELMWIFGIYLAEGSIKNRDTNHPSLYFTLSSDEKEYAEKINKFSIENLGHECWVQEWDDYNFIQVNIFDSNFSKLVNNIFGHGFKNKRIPHWIFGLDISLIESLIDGFLCGDGTNYEGLEDDSYLFSIANPTMAYEIGLLARLCRKSTRFNFLCKGKLIKNRTITASISNINNSKIYCLQSPTTVEVFDMEVEDDHSFVAGDIVCHNCFVIPSCEDSYGGICHYDEQLAQVSKRRGGVGGDVAKLRPLGARTKNAARSSTGKVQFMSRFSNTIREVGQNGRRGAEMITTSIHHPETVIVWDRETMGEPYETIVDTEDDFGNPIQFKTTSDKFDPNNIDFVTCKYDKTKVTGANISIRLTDEFLTALEKGQKFQQRWPVDKEEFEKRKAEGKYTYEKWVDAKTAWDKIITSAWQMAEPGLLFWDTIIRESPADCYSEYGFKTVSTNPCGEIPLSGYDSCRLMVLNLFHFVENPWQENAYFNFKKFYEKAQRLQRLMDDLVDLEEEAINRIIDKIKNDPEPENLKRNELELWQNILKACIEGRRTGCGITALGDALGALGIGYASKDGIKIVDNIYRTLKFGCYRSSVDMAKELGSFNVWNHDLEKNNPFINRFKEEQIQLNDSVTIYGKDIWDDMKNYGRRNISLLTTAPTGSISMLAKLVKYFGTSSGIEPEYSDEPYTRKKKGNPGDQNFRSDSVDQNGDHWMHFEIFSQAMKDWMDATGEKDWKKNPFHGWTADRLDWKQRVRLQATAQKHIDHSISSTVNLPSDVTVERVKEIYETAWKEGCFKEGNHIYTENGLKDISEICEGDFVYGNDGNLHKVDEVYDLPIETRKFIKFKINGHEGIESTAGHPYLVIELDEKENKKSWENRSKKIVWKNAEEIKINDHLLIPNFFEKSKKTIKEIDVTKYIKFPYIEEDGKIWIARKLPWKENKIVKAANSNPIPRFININEDLCWFIGWFIAEGHYDSESYIRLTLNYEKEQEVANKAIEIIQTVFGIKGYKEKIESNNGISLRVQFGSKLLYQLFKGLCGEYSDGKHLPDWFMNIERGLLKVIVDNHFSGDAGITISKRLARELFMARNILSQKVFMHENYGQGFDVHEQISDFETVAKVYGNYNAYRISSKEYYFSDEKVYNFSVEDVDSYIVNGIVVHNCKGITVYRDGCRTGVLIRKTKEEKQERIQKTQAPKRPVELPHEVHHCTRKGHRYVVSVGFLHGDPYEVFINSNHDHDGEIIIPKSIKEGVVKKEARGKYMLRHFNSKGELTEYPLNNGQCDPEMELIARDASRALRHGIDIAYIVRDLEKIPGDMFASSKVVARVLKKYIEDGFVVTGEECPECKKSELVRQDGCVKCKNCGWTKCG